MNKFAKLIYTLRKEKGMTQAELGEQLGLTDKAVSRWETGESYPETAQLIPLSAFFDISIDELLKGERRETVSTNEQPEPEILPVKTYTKEIPLSPKQTLQLLLGLGFLFVGVLAIIVLSQLNVHYTSYLTIFFVLLTASIMTFINMGMHKDLEDNYAEEIDRSKARRYIMLVALGVGCFLLMPIALIRLTITEQRIIASCAACVLLMIGLGMVIYGGVGWDREVMSKRKVNTRATYTSSTSTRIHSRNKAYEKASSVIMLLATMVFLLLGFAFDLWHPGWVVFPVGGLLCGIASILGS